MKRGSLEVSAEKRNARKADRIRLCGHLRRYKKIVKKTYMIYINFYNIFFVQFSSLLIHTKSSIYNSVLVKEREITFASLLPGVPMNVCTFPGFADLKPTDMLCAVSTQSYQAPALSINHILLSS